MSKTKESLEHVESMMLDTIGNNGKHDLKKEDIDLKKAEKHIAESPPEISEEAEKRANLAESEKIKAKKKQEEFEKVRLNEEEAKRNMANSPSKEASKEADEAVVEKEKKAEELADAVDTFEDSEEKLETTLDTAETGSPKKRKYLSGKIISKVGNKKAAHFLRPSKDKDAPMSKDLPVTEDDIGPAPVKNPDNSPVSEDDDGPEPPRPNNMQPQEASEIKAFVVPKGQKCRYAAGHKKTGQPVTSVTDCNKKSNNKCKWNAAKGACKPGTPRMATDNNDGNDGSDGNAPAKNVGIPQHYSNCWNACKKKSGPCEHVCGAGGLCCRNKHRGGENGCGYRWGGHWKHSCVSSNGVLLKMATDGLGKRPSTVKNPDNSPDTKDGDGKNPDNSPVIEDDDGPESPISQSKVSTPEDDDGPEPPKPSGSTRYKRYTRLSKRRSRSKVNSLVS
jgi:hypothetical protein